MSRHNYVDVVCFMLRHSFLLSRQKFPPSTLKLCCNSFCYVVIFFLLLFSIYVVTYFFFFATEFLLVAWIFCHDRLFLCHDKVVLPCIAETELLCRDRDLRLFNFYCRDIIFLCRDRDVCFQFIIMLQHSFLCRNNILVILLNFCRNNSRLCHDNIHLNFKFSLSRQRNSLSCKVCVSFIADSECYAVT